MKTKTSVKLLALLLALTMAAFAMISCDFEEIFSSGDYCTVVVASKSQITEYSVDLGKVEVKEGVFSILEWLKSEGKLDFEAVESSYGKYLNWVGDAKPEATNEYVRIMTSVEKDFDTSEYFTESEYNGKRIGTSGLGASSMTVEANAIFYFSVSSY